MAGQTELCALYTWGGYNMHTPTEWKLSGCNWRTCQSYYHAGANQGLTSDYLLIGAWYGPLLCIIYFKQSKYMGNTVCVFSYRLLGCVIIAEQTSLSDIIWNRTGCSTQMTQSIRPKAHTFLFGCTYTLSRIRKWSIFIRLYSETCI